MSLSVGAKLGPYEILAPLGAGGMGEVYRARDTKLKRDVAMKVLPGAFAEDPERMARFQREAEVLASLNHTNIAQIYGVEERALVMELVEGESPKGPLPFEEAWKIASQIAAGLEYAHEKGIVHRDLKPANVKITPDGLVKLLDFGLAKAFTTPVVSSNPENSPTLTLGATQLGVILGTAAYMAPEQAKGKNVDKRADIWAFGVVLYELLTGEQLFHGEDVADTLAQVLTKHPSLEKTPPEVRKLLGRCLNKDPKQRLRDIGEARFWLESGALPDRIPSRSRFAWLTAAVATLTIIPLAVIASIHYRELPRPAPVLRYTIAMPGSVTTNSFAISPDGQYVAIAANASGRSEPQLWLRRLDSLQAQVMPTTEGAAFPFWSPDSRYIGFFTPGKLKKIAVSGGPSQSICDGGITGAGTWSRNDVILFSPGNAENVIRRVAASGGTPTEVLRGNNVVGYPVFLPDGRHFLYRLNGAAPGKNGIHVGSLDGSEGWQILPDVSSPAFAPPSSGIGPGYILFIRENNLMAQPFDIRTNQAMGDVFPVAENVFLGQANYSPVTASGNGVLLYWTGALTGASNQLMWYDRTGTSTPAGVTGNVIMPSISPDEKVIAFSRSVGTADIWLRDLIRRTDIRFTSDALQNFTPTWSPKSDRIAFRANRGEHIGDLFVKSANGSDPADLLLSTPNQKVINQWSRDGKFLVYYEVDPNTKRDIWVLPIGEGPLADRKPFPVVRTAFQEHQGQLSPDSRWLAYTSDESGQREVYVKPFPTGEGLWKISTAGGEQPRWRGDGQELFYVAAEGKMTAVQVKAPAGQKPSFQPGTPVPLFDVHLVNFGAAQFFNYDVTADGKRFVAAVTGTSAEANIALTVVVNWNTELKKRPAKR